jgi:hypothetical protein
MSALVWEVHFTKEGVINLHNFHSQSHENPHIIQNRSGIVVHTPWWFKSDEDQEVEKKGSK